MKPNTARGFTWHWTPQLWQWNPAEGPWRPEHGGPKTVAYLELTTAMADPDEAYDFWCESAFPNFEPDARRAAGATPFQARARGWCSPRANVFAYESAPVSGRRSRRQAQEPGAFDIGIVFAGVRHYRCAEGGEIVSGPNDFFVYDPGRPCRIHWTAHKGIHVTVSRSIVDEAFGGQIPDPETIARVLAASPLGPFLRHHLTLLAKAMPRLSPFEQSLLTDQLLQLLQGALRHGQAPIALGSARDRRAIFVAAQSYIDAHLRDPNLNTNKVARAVGCSASTLYRAFADEGESVSRHIRERRLQLFWQLLHEAPEETITELAHRCGFDNIGYVSKQFRRHFGMSPREARAAARRDDAGALGSATPM